jgi:hypothetical protein
VNAVFRNQLLVIFLGFCVGHVVAVAPVVKMHASVVWRIQIFTTLGPCMALGGVVVRVTKANLPVIEAEDGRRHESASKSSLSRATLVVRAKAILVRLAKILGQRRALFPRMHLFLGLAIIRRARTHARRLGGRWDGFLLGRAVLKVRLCFGGGSKQTLCRSRTELCWLEQTGVVDATGRLLWRWLALWRVLSTALVDATTTAATF